MVARADNRKRTLPESPPRKRTPPGRSYSETAYRGWLQLSAPRYYSPELGRWVNRDPIVDEGFARYVLETSALSIPRYWASSSHRFSITPYGFLSSDPVNWTDWLGLSGQNGDNGSAKKCCDMDCASGDYDEIGYQAIQKAVSETKADPENDEYCGHICCKDGKLEIIGPYEGEHDVQIVCERGGFCYKDYYNRRCDPSQRGDCAKAKGKGWATVGRYHSHPPRSCNFSDADKRNADSTGQCSFLGAPFCRAKRYEPDPDKNRGGDVSIIAPPEKGSRSCRL